MLLLSLLIRNRRSVNSFSVSTRDAGDAAAADNVDGGSGGGVTTTRATKCTLIFTTV